MQGQTDFCKHNQGGKLEFTSVGNTEHILKKTFQYYGVDDNEVATSEISVLGSGDEEIAEMVSTKHKYYD